jgi:hypothetical protein
MGAASEKRWQALHRELILRDHPASSFPHPQAHPPVQSDYSTRLPSKAFVRSWFFDNYESCLIEGESGPTQAVESFAATFPDCAHWLDDREHWIWDLAVDVESRLIRAGVIL